MPRLRFSLLNFVFMMTIVAMAFTLWRQYNKLDLLKVEVETMREQLGLLTIGDPEKIYVVEVPTAATHEWVWRLYLPRGSYALFSANRAVRAGVPKPDWARQFTAVAEKEEVVLRAKISLEDKSLYLNVKGQSFRLPEIGSSDLELPEGFYDSTQSTFEIAGAFGQESYDANTEIILLQESDFFVANTDSEWVPGLTLWLGLSECVEIVNLKTNLVR